MHTIWNIKWDGHGWNAFVYCLLNAFKQNNKNVNLGNASCVILCKFLNFISWIKTLVKHHEILEFLLHNAQ